MYSRTAFYTTRLKANPLDSVKTGLIVRTECYFYMESYSIQHSVYVYSPTVSITFRIPFVIRVLLVEEHCDGVLPKTDR